MKRSIVESQRNDGMPKKLDSKNTQPKKLDSDFKDSKMGSKRILKVRSSKTSFTGKYHLNRTESRALDDPNE